MDGGVRQGVRTFGERGELEIEDGDSRHGGGVRGACGVECKRESGGYDVCDCVVRDAAELVEGGAWSDRECVGAVTVQLEDGDSMTRYRYCSKL